MGPTVNLCTPLTLLVLAIGCGHHHDPPIEPGADAGVDAAAVPDAGGEGEDAGAPDAAVGPDCTAIPAVPVEFEHLDGFEASEDFQFDDEGRWVGGDDNGNIVRITRDGEKRLFVPNAGAGGAGMKFLSNGDLVFARVDDGTLYRASPQGGMVAVLSGLLYPNGVEVDLQDQVYVSEQAVGRVRKIDPMTGAFTIVARGLSNPNGLSFSPDYRTLYCGSFGAGVIYAIPFDADGIPATPTIFAQTPEAPGADPPEGPTPESTDACAGLGDGDACTVPAEEGDGTNDGTCYTLGHTLYCDATTGSWDPGIDACMDAALSDTCTVDYGEDFPSADGVCIDAGGYLYCITDPGIVACGGLGAGDPCTVEGSDAGEGECYDYEDYLYCVLPSPSSTACEGLDDGDDCTIVWGEADEAEGECVNDGFGGLVCYPPLPWVVACEGLTEGDACSYDDGTDTGTIVDAQCEEYQGGVLSCGIDPSADPFQTVCEDLAEGDDCAALYLGETFSGACVDYYGDGSLYCEVQPDTETPCVGLAEGDACTVDYFGYPYDSVCSVAEDDGVLICDIGLGAGGHGGLDGLGVDACGYVYVTEYGIGKVWRITPDGVTVELLFDPPVAWIPNLHWGNGRGGFAVDKLYVANRDDAALYEVTVGVPGVTRSYP